uniref:Uncharacterized protein n=1 Tax=Sphaerodactylus townsendi TaxID=933632 RepID=A0ACB8E9D0_9SAUR
MPKTPLACSVAKVDDFTRQIGRSFSERSPSDFRELKRVQIQWRRKVEDVLQRFESQLKWESLPDMMNTFPCRDLKLQVSQKACITSQKASALFHSPQHVLIVNLSLKDILRMPLKHAKERHIFHHDFE